LQPEPPTVVIEEDNEATIEKDRYKHSTGLSAAFLARKRRKLNTMALSDEYTRYIEHWDYTGDEIKDVLRWWQDRTIEFPILSRMAMDILSIPGMSAEVERVFSNGGRLITDDRNTLSEESIMACLIQNHGLKAGLFTAGDIS